MKKGLKITGIILVILLAIMISIPFMFSGKIESIVKKEANKMLDAEFNFAALDISLFKNFPKASITLKDFWIKGVEEFQSDTLVSGKELTATVDIMSLFKDDGFEVDQVILNKAALKAIILKGGKVNWDIMKDSGSDSEIEVAKESDSDSNFELKLKKIAIKNLSLIFDDREGNQLASISDLNLNLSGDLSSQKTVLKIEGETPALSYQSGAMQIGGISLKAKIDLDADLANNVFTLQKNEIQLNAIKTNIDGWVALLDNDAMELDLKLNTSEVGFKEILSLIPAIYAKDFKDIQTDGTAILTAYAKGKMQGDNVPAFDLTLDIKEGSFKYPSLPAGVDQITIHANVNNPGGSADKTEIKIAPFMFRMANNPFQVNAIISTPISDPKFDVNMSGLLDLGKIKEVYPLEDMTLNGNIQADLSIAGQMSFIEKEQYDKIKSSGTIKLQDMSVVGKETPDLKINKSLLTFSPEFLKLSETTLFIGDNDITLDSQLNNYIGYALKGSTIKGNLNIKSNRLNLNELMGAESDVSETENDSVFGIIEIPKNIDFNMTAQLKEVLFGTMTLSDVNGGILIKDGKANMSNLSLNTMGGEVIMNGYYSTEKIEHPTINANFALNKLSFAETYKELDMIKSLAPLFGSLKGNFSGSMKLNTELNESMEPIYSTFFANGNIKTQDVSLSEVEVVQKLAKALKQEDLANRPIKDLDLDFEVKEGMLETKPFNFNMGEYMLSVGGKTGLDQSIDYKGDLKLPESMTAVKGLDTFSFIIGGSFNSPTFKVDTKSMLKEGGKVLEDKAKEFIGKELGLDSAVTANKDSLEKEIKSKATEKIKDLFNRKKNK